jgi:hypothetical protein
MNASPDETANTKDVRSVDGIVAALYDTISGPAGAKRDWDRLHRLFHPGARLLRTVVASAGGISMSAMDAQAFAELTPLLSPAPKTRMLGHGLSD